MWSRGTRPGAPTLARWPESCSPQVPVPHRAPRDWAGVRGHGQDPTAPRKVRARLPPAFHEAQSSTVQAQEKRGRMYPADNTRWEDLAPCAPGQPCERPQRPARGRGPRERDGPPVHRRAKPLLGPGLRTCSPPLHGFQGFPSAPPHLSASLPTGTYTPVPPPAPPPTTLLSPWAAPPST